MTTAAAGTGEVALTARPEVISRLKRLGLMKKDAKGEWYYETTFNAQPLKFYEGYGLQLPLDWARALVGHGGNGGYGDGVWMDVDELCQQCKGKGQTALGKCHECKGAKYVLQDRKYHIFRMISEVDPTDFTNEGLLQRKLEPASDVDEAAGAMA